MLYAGSALGESTPLIYKVTNKQGNTIYLLGTIHIGDRDMYPLSAAVEQAYQDSDILAVEMDLLAVQEDMAKMLEYSFSLMYTDGTKASDHMDPETYALGVETLGQPEMVLQMMRPVAWLSLAQEQSYTRIGQSADLGVDMMLLKRAREDGKTIHELESLESQMETLMSMPDKLVEFQLQQYFAYPEATDFSMRLLSAAWQQGNEDAFSVLLAQDAVGIPSELEAEYAAYEENLLHSRDNLFEQKAIEYLENGDKVLFAVGAAHIVGEGALADRLEKAGYTVEEIGR